MMLLLDKVIAIVVLITIIFGSVLVVNGQRPNGRILTGPLSQIIAPGDTAYFNCHALGYTVEWYINGSYLSLGSRSTYEAKGFDFNDTDITQPAANQLHEENNTIVVEANSSINNTHIKCRARGLDHGQYTDADATMIVIGPPLAPPYNLTQEHLTNNFILHNISWSAPFTWSGFPITSYEIEIRNYSNGDVTTITKSNESSTYLFISDGSDCYRLDFSVFAYNSAGQSEAIVTPTGHPIVSGKIKDIETNATLLADGTTQLSISFLAPKICSEYQTGTITIAIYTRNNIHHLVQEFEAENYTQNATHEGKLVHKVVEANLTVNQLYQVFVKIESIGVTVSNSSIFSTYYYTHGTVHVQENATATEAIGSSVRHIQRSTVAGVTSGGVAFCILILIVSITACFVCKSTIRNRRRTTDIDGDNHPEEHQGKNKTRPASLRMQSSNPIYEGAAIYETMPGESCKSLLSPGSVSTPGTPLADLNTRYTFDTSSVPSLPLPRKASVCQPPMLKSVEEGDPPLEQVELPPSANLGGDYMVMQNQLTGFDVTGSSA